MPYHRPVHVFVEAPVFSKLIYDYLTDDEYADMQAFLSAHPARDTIPAHVLKALKEEMEDGAD